jgi:hypothetical protein
VSKEEYGQTRLFISTPNIREYIDNRTKYWQQNRKLCFQKRILLCWISHGDIWSLQRFKCNVAYNISLVCLKKWPSTTADKDMGLSLSASPPNLASLFTRRRTAVGLSSRVFITYCYRFMPKSWPTWRHGTSAWLDGKVRFANVFQVLLYVPKLFVCKRPSAAFIHAKAVRLHTPFSCFHTRQSSSSANVLQLLSYVPKLFACKRHSAAFVRAKAVRLQTSFSCFRTCQSCSYDFTEALIKLNI